LKKYASKKWRKQGSVEVVAASLSELIGALILLTHIDFGYFLRNFKLEVLWLTLD
jgi:hypothetical protein